MIHDAHPTALSLLPTEILMLIVKYLDTERDINALARVSRRLYSLLDQYLYQFHQENGGNLALVWAVRHGSLTTALKVLDAGSDVNHEFCGPPACLHPYFNNSTDRINHIYKDDAFHFTPLMYAVRCNQGAIVRQFLKISNVDVNWTDELLQTPLFIAARDGFTDIVLALMEHEEIDVSIADIRGTSPLMCAIMNGDVDLTMLLLKAGAPPHGPNGDDPIHFAICQRHIPLLNALLRAPGFDKDFLQAPIGALLCFAAMQQDDDLFYTLVDFDDSEVNWQDAYGRSTISWVAARGHQDMMRRLITIPHLDVNIECTTINEIDLRPQIMHVEDICSRRWEPLGRNTHEVPEQRVTPLMLASKFGHFEIIQILLSRKETNLLHSSNSRITAYAIAREYHHWQIAKFLRDCEHRRRLQT